MHQLTCNDCDISYICYANDMMKKHELYEKFKEELNKCKLTDVLKGYHNNVIIISEVMMKIIGDNEEINEQEIKKRYLDYMNNTDKGYFSVGLDVYVSSFEHYGGREFDRLLFAETQLIIPEQIKIYCLCLKVRIEQYHVDDRR